MQSILSNAYAGIVARYGHLSPPLGAYVEVDGLGIGDLVREKTGGRRKGTVVDRRIGDALVSFTGARVWLPCDAIERAGRQQAAS